MTIDAHHHLWHYDPVAYSWIGEDMEVLKRDFTADNLSAEIDGLVDGVIAVQARQDVDETRWLLDEARDAAFILGVVGWLPLTAGDIDRQIDSLAQDPALVGVRHVLQDEPDDAFMHREDFNRGISLLNDHGLAYDILIYERHLENAIRFVDRHASQVFVLDHIGKPRIRDGELEPWTRRLKALAERENCYCKLSGLVTEATWGSWTPDDLYPYLDAVLDAFGPSRLMFGSDWPVCLLACDYGDWYHLVDEYLSELSHGERRRIWGGTAAEAYGLCG